jgi:hypothetical protein
MRWVATLILLQVFTPLLLSQEKGTEKMECTPYPVYYCYPSGRPAHPLSKAQIDARQKASEQAVAEMAEHAPACTPYPWYSCPGVPGTLAPVAPGTLGPGALEWYAIYNQVCTPFPAGWTCDRRTIWSDGLSMTQPAPW